VLKIGDFSKLSQVTVKTLRHYDQLGLLKPAEIDNFTGYRYYSVNQLPRLNRILALKDLGLSLEQIGQLLNNNLSADQIRGILRLKQVELQQQVAQEQARLARVEVRLKQIEQENEMSTIEPIIKKVDAQLVAAIRDIAPSYGEQGALWAELATYIDPHRLNIEEPVVTVYYDTEYRERDVDLEVVVPINRPIPATNRVRVYQLPGAETMACALHQGNFDTLSQTYTALLKWIETNGYQIVGPNREVYLRCCDFGLTQSTINPDFVTDTPANFLTEVQFPVTPTAN